MEELNLLREKIDGIDQEIIGLLEERVKLAEEIGEHKKKKGAPIRDEAREREVLARLAESTILNPEFTKNLYEKIIRYCRENEQ